MGTSTIWTNNLQRRFYEKLSCMNKQPIPETKYNADSTQSDHIFPYDIELCIADYFAFVSSSVSGAKCVAAATVEEHQSSCNIIIRIAANEGIPERVVQSLKKIARHMESYAKKGGVISQSSSYVEIANS
jgi:hypothetical protein